MNYFSDQPIKNSKEYKYANLGRSSFSLMSTVYELRSTYNNIFSNSFR